jgi:hypothetical protein
MPHSSSPAATVRSLGEFDAAATNISMVMAGIDPETKVTDPQMAIKKKSRM